MDNRERFLKTMRFEPVDHPPLHIPGPWAATRARWEQEGLPVGADLHEFFGVPKIEMGMGGIQNVFMPPFEEKILEETDEFIIKINNRGVTEQNFKDGSSMPEFLDYPVKGREALSWLRKKLNPESPGRFPEDWLENLQAIRDRGGLTLQNGGQYFAFLNEHMGTEELLMTYFDDPGFIHEVNELQCSLCESILKKILPEFKLDALGYHEDMAYKNGSMISPDMFREFMSPYYARVTSIAKQHGVDLHMMDSDGNVWELIPLWLEQGINIICPMEVAAGMDIIKLRREFGHDLMMMGGFDKRILAAGKSQIKQELERLRPVIEEGGYIPQIDHGTPPDVSLENAVYYVECLKTMFGMK